MRHFTNDKAVFIKNRNQLYLRIYYLAKTEPPRRDADNSVRLREQDQFSAVSEVKTEACDQNPICE